MFHLVGHSLGAHVCGQAGAYYKILSNETIDRIDGLDPAGPLFLDQNAFDRFPTNQLEEIGIPQNLSSVDESAPNSEQENYFDAFLIWINSIGSNSRGENNKEENGEEDKEEDEEEDADYLKAMKHTISMQKVAVPDQSRLDKNDAEFVMVIHTNAFGFGGFENIGTIYFDIIYYAFVLSKLVV